MTRHFRQITLLSVALLPLGLTAQDKTAEKPKDPTTEHPAYKYDPAAEHRVYNYDPAITDCRKQITRSQMTDCRYALSQIKIIRFENSYPQVDANEILVAVRNMFDPSIKIYLASTQNAIAVETDPEEITRIEAFVRALDQPHKSYRLTFTLADSENGKRIGVQHFSLVAVSGQRTTLKQGTKVPVATGSYDDAKNGPVRQFTYLDVGINIDVTLDQSGSSLHLKSKIEQSGLAEEKSSLGQQDPVVRQSILEGSYNLIVGKPIALGQIDVPGTTRHVDVEVVAEPIQ